MNSVVAGLQIACYNADRLSLWAYRGGAAMPGKIFINYRRDDAIATAGRLHDRLAQAFGRTYRRRTLPAKSFEANPWMLYQVHGNVWRVLNQASSCSIGVEAHKMPQVALMCKSGQTPDQRAS
jgi:hypothetical protein